MQPIIISNPLSTIYLFIINRVVLAGRGRAARTGGSTLDNKMIKAGGKILQRVSIFSRVVSCTHARRILIIVHTYPNHKIILLL